MASEQQCTQLCHRDGLSWDLISAGSMNKPLVLKGVKGPCMHCWALRDPLLATVFFCLALLKCPILRKGALHWTYFSAAAILKPQERKKYITRSQTGKQRLRMSRVNVPSDRIISQKNKFHTKHCKNIRWSFFLHSWDVEVATHPVPCLCAKGHKELLANKIMLN